MSFETYGRTLYETGSSNRLHVAHESTHRDIPPTLREIYPDSVFFFFFFERVDFLTLLIETMWIFASADSNVFVPSGSLTIPRDLIPPQGFSALSFAPDVEEAASGFSRIVHQLEVRTIQRRLFSSKNSDKLTMYSFKYSSYVRYIRTRH